MQKQTKVMLGVIILLFTITLAFGAALYFKTLPNMGNVILAQDLLLTETDHLTPIAGISWGDLFHGNQTSYTFSVCNIGESQVWIFYRTDTLPGGITLGWLKNTSGWSDFVTRYPLLPGQWFNIRIFLNVAMDTPAGPFAFNIYLDAFATETS